MMADFRGTRVILYSDAMHTSQDDQLLTYLLLDNTNLLCDYSTPTHLLSYRCRIPSRLCTPCYLTYGARRPTSRPSTMHTTFPRHPVLAGKTNGRGGRTYNPSTSDTLAVERESSTYHFSGSKVSALIGHRQPTLLSLSSAPSVGYGTRHSASFISRTFSQSAMYRPLGS